jgi:hypothetical protein
MNPKSFTIKELPLHVYRQNYVGGNTLDPAVQNIFLSSCRENVVDLEMTIHGGRYFGWHTFILLFTHLQSIHMYVHYVSNIPTFYGHPKLTRLHVSGDCSFDERLHLFQVIQSAPKLQDLQLSRWIDRKFSNPNQSFDLVSFLPSTLTHLNLPTVQLSTVRLLPTILPNLVLLKVDEVLGMLTFSSDAITPIWNEVVQQHPKLRHLSVPLLGLSQCTPMFTQLESLSCRHVTLGIQSPKLDTRKCLSAWMEEMDSKASSFRMTVLKLPYTLLSDEDSALLFKIFRRTLTTFHTRIKTSIYFLGSHMRLSKLQRLHVILDVNCDLQNLCECVSLTHLKLITTFPLHKLWTIPLPQLQALCMEQVCKNGSLTWMKDLHVIAPKLCTLSIVWMEVYNTLLALSEIPHITIQELECIHSSEYDYDDSLVLRPTTELEWIKTFHFQNLRTLRIPFYVLYSSFLRSALQDRIHVTHELISEFMLHICDRM